ncbi:hypothetical protein [Staphylococcus xylosus]|uniref:hypothetical protein n=1 Tax=Staphylococcus xylosus TaxID=1288 RepID=UPI001CDB8555|nr:hypothetical protein [Staphylococcus xylosus]MCA2504001.1 hypothetical protein [Staphylococcus xylosus]MCQ3820670.1 hypothetical protein [Staphylococcus xylosus]
MSEILSILILIVMFGIQYALSTNSNKFLGAIIPVLFVIFVGFMYFNDKLGPITSIVLLILGLIALLEQWYKGNKQKKVNSNKEMVKMKGKDL